MQRNENKERHLTSYDILDRFSDGKILEAGEYYDRVMLSQQIGLIFSILPKRITKRIS